MDKVGSYNLHAGRNRHFVACKVHHHGLGVYEKNKQGIIENVQVYLVIDAGMVWFLKSIPIMRSLLMMS